MDTGEGLARGSLILTALLLLLFTADCTEIRLNTIPSPPPSAKLRVFVQPISGPPPPHGWLRIPHEEFKRRHLRAAERFLRETGIYEVIAEEEVLSVLKRQKVMFWQWKRDDWALAREVGQALHAEYTMIMERSWRSGFYWQIVLINVNTGKQFAVFSGLALGSDQHDVRKIIRASYREIFRDAKKDLLTTAVRKGRLAPTQTRPVASSVPEILPSIAASPASPMPPKEASSSPLLGRKVDLENALQVESIGKGRVQVAVYDLDSEQHLKVVALILSDALREELFHLGSYTLVNRENINRVMEELMFGQIGLVDDKQAVKAGKALAADQIVVGRLSVIGSKSVLQLKRIRTETHHTLAFTSSKCKIGKEEELLDRMPELARRLAGIP